MSPVRALALACVCLAAVAGAARAQSDDAEARAQACYQRGRAAYDKHDWEGAIREFETGYRNKPSPLFLHDIGDAAEHAGQRQKALDHYQLYLQISPNATDREVVQQRIDALQKSLAGGDALQPAPDAVVAQPAAARPQKSRTKLIIAVSVVGAVVVVGAVAIGTVLGESSSSDYHAWGSLTVMPH